MPTGSATPCCRSWRRRRSPAGLRALADYLPLLPLALAIWGGLLLSSGRYRSHRTVPLLDEAWAIVRVCMSGAILFTLALYLSRWDERLLGDDRISRFWSLLFAAFCCVFLLSEKLALRLTSRYVRAHGFNYRTVLIVGTSDAALRIADSIHGHRFWGYRILGFIRNEHSWEESWPVSYPILGEIEDLPRIVESHVVDDVIFAVHRRELDRLEDLFLSLQEQGIRTRFAMDLFPHTRARVELEELDGVPLLSFATTPTNPLQLMLKRVLDVALASFLLLIGMPIAGMIALTIKLTSGGGSVLFRQTRCGLNGRSFTLYKFRTMVEGAEERRRELMHLNEMNGPVFKLRSDPRVTRLGRLPAPLQPRRAAAALERAARRHEPGGPAAADPRGGGPVPALAAPPPGHEARPHLPLADQRPQRPRLRPLDAARPGVHRLLVAAARSQDPAEDGAGGAVRAGGFVARLRPPYA